MSAANLEKPFQVKSFFAVFRRNPIELEEIQQTELFGAEPGKRICASSDRRMVAGFSARTAIANDWPKKETLRFRLILGEPSEFNEEESGAPMANGALVEFDLEKKSVTALSSIVGLPPIFVYEDSEDRILTSHSHFLAALVRSGLDFDPEGVLDLCCYGFPVEHRTLFRNVRLLAGGTRLKAASGGAIECKRAWEFREPKPLPDWNSYTDLQIEAFQSALRKMDLKDSFLSMTAGLDTRTIFAVLVGEGRAIPGFTLSGVTPSLDARTARALCGAYGVAHSTVPLNREFEQNLAKYTVEASRLSGGLASLGQAHQIHLYRKLPRAYAGRVSGNMGNQLGRGGVEHVTMRGADPSVLNADLQKEIPERPRFAWTKQTSEGSMASSHEFLFQQEFPFTQIGNYAIGNFYAVQHSPYASRDLIAACSLQPLKRETAQAISPLRLRLNDLHHRFLGESEIYSFQRRLIHRMGGFAAKYPINWGWRAKGGISPVGVFRGCMTALDAYSERG